MAQENGGETKKTFEITIPKLILRNLSFKINEDILKKEMSQYGTVSEVLLPLRADGKKCGYGFVKFSEMNEAATAMEALNNKKDKFHGTKVAVDWCLPKRLYEKNTGVNRNGQNQSEPKKEVKTPPVSKPTLNKRIQLSDDDEEEEEEDDEDGSEENDEDDEKSGSEEDDDDNDDDNDDEDKDEDEDDDEDEEEEEEEEENEEDKEKNKRKKEKLKIKAKVGTKDVVEKRTIFIRNISFNATEDGLKEVFSKFGEIKYVKLVMDRDFERPKGTGFIQFATAQAALDACSESDILEHDSRRLQIDLAISRDQATDMVTEKKTKEPTDNRNLALAKEGVVYPNSYEAKGLNKSDLDKRAKIEASNNAKLKILHYFVSTTRLSVHNIPVKCTDQELKTIFLNALNNNTFDEALNKKNSHKIVECRIMRDLTRVNSEGVAKSKGFGFVEFTKFEDALKALRATNNNPGIFTDDKKTRLIVQFSIEDKRALKKKASRFEKFQKKSEEKLSKGNKLKFNMIKQKLLTKKSKKNRKSADETIDESVGNDIEEDKNRRREKNLIRTHMIEKKLNKRKNEEEKKSDNKKQKVEHKQHQQQQPKVEDADFEAKKAIALEKKQKYNQMKREKQKNKAAEKKKNQKVDNVDRLVDKYIDERNNKGTKRKWYENK